MIKSSDNVKVTSNGKYQDICYKFDENGNDIAGVNTRYGFIPMSEFIKTSVQTQNADKWWQNWHGICGLTSSMFVLIKLNSSGDKALVGYMLLQ